jgi:hypothetical protein
MADTSISLPAIYNQMDLPARLCAERCAAEICTRLRRVAEDIIAVGELLIEANDHLPHGAFGPLLKAEFDWSDQTALNFMNVARQARENPKLLEYADRFPTTALYLLAAPTTPDAAPEEALSRAEAGERLTNGQVRTLIDEARMSSGGGALLNRFSSWEEADAAARATAVSKPPPDPAPAAPVPRDTLFPELVADGWALQTSRWQGLPDYRATKRLRLVERGHLLRTAHGRRTVEEVEADIAPLRQVVLVERPDDVARKNWTILFDGQAWWVDDYQLLYAWSGSTADLRWPSRDALLENGRALMRLERLHWRVERHAGGQWSAHEQTYTYGPGPRRAVGLLPTLKAVADAAWTLVKGPAVAVPAGEHQDVVVHIGERPSPYELPPIARYPVLYHTPTTVRLAAPAKHLVDGKSPSRLIEAVWCLRCEDDWVQAQIAYTLLQKALHDLAAELRRLGNYAKRLAEADGVAHPPNPLTPTVITAADPDDPTPTWYWDTWRISPVERERVTRHTAQMLSTNGIHTDTQQRDHFVCPTGADWERVSICYQQVKATRAKWLALLDHYGTYRSAATGGTPSPASDLTAQVPDALRRAGWTAHQTPNGFICAEHAASQTRLLDSHLATIMAEVEEWQQLHVASPGAPVATVALGAGEADPDACCTCPAAWGSR